ncbi:MAG TPA: radical SAM protein [Bryobacteraceae bacterium]|nr:radical SAM protein [Bryobacteraceae bacterium]
MADVLLTHSNNLYADRKQAEKMQPYPPLQTILAAAVLRQGGFEAALYDPTLEAPGASPINAFELALAREQPRLAVVCEDDFNFLSKMCLTRNRELAFQMARVARSRGVSIAVHGSDASDHAREYLGAGFSSVLIGEVETTLLELAQGKAPHTIRGLAFDCAGSIHYNPPREVRANLDSLPEPAWDLVDVEQYRAAWKSAHGHFALNMASSRGCPYHCNWCAKPIYGQKFHCRSARSVAAEMLHLKTAYAPDRIWFADDIFALSPRWSGEFARAVEELGAAIPFKMQSRCDLMTRRTVSALKRAGCAEVWMGCESGSQKVLDAMDKGIRVEQIYEARENLRCEGIRAGFFLQFGYPGEGWSEIEATIRMVRETQPDDIGVSVSYPLPGTRFHEKVFTQIGTGTNWSDSADLAMVFQGAYPSEFYRALAEALHLEVRGEDGLDAAALKGTWQRVFELERRASAAPRLVEAVA